MHSVRKSPQLGIRRCCKRGLYRWDLFFKTNVNIRLFHKYIFDSLLGMVAHNAFNIYSHGERRKKPPWKLSQLWKSCGSQTMYLCRDVSVWSLLDQHTRGMSPWLAGHSPSLYCSCMWTRRWASPTSLRPLEPHREPVCLPPPAPLNKLHKGMCKSCGRDKKNWRSHGRCWALEYHLGLSNSSQNSLLRNCWEGWDGIVTQCQAGRKERRSSGWSLRIVTGASKIVAMLLITRQH